MKKKKFHIVKTTASHFWTIFLPFHRLCQASTLLYNTTKFGLIKSGKHSRTIFYEVGMSCICISSYTLVRKSFIWSLCLKYLDNLLNLVHCFICRYVLYRVTDYDNAFNTPKRLIHTISSTDSPTNHFVLGRLFGTSKMLLLAAK